jgi:hypothetical protein
VAPVPVAAKARVAGKVPAVVGATTNRRFNLAIPAETVG